MSDLPMRHHAGPVAAALAPLDPARCSCGARRLLPAGLAHCPGCGLVVKLREGAVPEHGCGGRLVRLPAAGPWG